ncbi:MAG: GNAT family N-acetyltransferase [Actinomycetota bacterium]|nr:GNAT family N-acetyltransferase [Actinomycetota bacterium]
MSDVLERIRRFEREIEMAGSRTVPSPFGVGVLEPSLPRRHDSNYLLVDRLPLGVAAEELAAEADRILGGAGVAHRAVFTFDERFGATLERQFRELGWNVRRHIWMAQLRPPGRSADRSVVREVTEAELRPPRMREIVSQPWGSNEVAKQLLDAKLLLAERAETRFFGVRVNGEIVSWADLYIAQGVGQVEDLATAAEHRGRGYASALVLHAADEARRAGADLVFLVADEDDWPKELYRRLGFETVGRLTKFFLTG